MNTKRNRIAALFISGLATFLLSNALLNRDGKHGWVPPMVTVYTIYATHKRIREIEDQQQSPDAINDAATVETPAATFTPPDRPMIQYAFERINDRTLLVRVRAVDYEPFGDWRHALKATSGIRWAKKIRQAKVNGRLLCTAKGYVEDTDELTAEEQSQLVQDLKEAGVELKFKRRPTLAYLELCRHSVRFNAPETSFEQCIELRDEFFN